MVREFGSTSPAVSRCHRGPCPGLANQDHGRGDSESQLGPSGGGCDRERAMVGDLMDGCDIWVKGSDPHPVVSRCHRGPCPGLANQDHGRGHNGSHLVEYWVRGSRASKYLGSTEVAVKSNASPLLTALFCLAENN